MKATSRRSFLESVGGGMLVVGLGTSLSTELGLRSVFADETPRELSFGRYDALVDLMQNNAPEALQPILIEKLSRGQTNAKDLIAAGALANRLVPQGPAKSSEFRVMEKSEIARLQKYLQDKFGNSQLTLAARHHSRMTCARA